MKNLMLVKRAPFGSMTVDYYGDGRGEFYMTREQIGRALGYNNPDDAIYRIHKRHRDRLDPLSVVVKLSSTDGKKYETRVYEAKGIYEICRHSDKPAANAFYDAVYEILEGLRLGYFKLKAELESPIWQDTRTLGKQIRKEEGDTIALFVEYATGQGSRNASRYYKNLSVLADNAAGITNRDTATVMQLNSLLMVERIIASEIKKGMSESTPYKEIYQSCKARLGQFVSVAGLKGV